MRQVSIAVILITALLGGGAIAACTPTSGDDGSSSTVSGTSVADEPDSYDVVSRWVPEDLDAVSAAASAIVQGEVLGLVGEWQHEFAEWPGDAPVPSGNSVLIYELSVERVFAAAPFLARPISEGETILIGTAGPTGRGGEPRVPEYSRGLAEGDHIVVYLNESVVNDVAIYDVVVSDYGIVDVLANGERGRSRAPSGSPLAGTEVPLSFEGLSADALGSNDARQESVRTAPLAGHTEPTVAQVG